jgi:hypothetical protein
VFLGQTVVGYGIPSGTTITGIDGDVLTLSQKATATSNNVAITFGAPGRNVVQYNNRGIVLTKGNAIVTNSDIQSNIMSGIDLVAGTYAIGTSKTLADSSNAIFANGGWAVRLSAPLEQAVINKSLQVQVQGNYFGSAVRATAGIANTRGDVGTRQDDGVERRADDRTGFNPEIPANQVTVKDVYGNQYVRPGSARTASKIRFPWRQQ